MTPKWGVNVLRDGLGVYHHEVLAEILTIGDELCRGEIVDTNSSWLAAELWDLDITVAWMTSCRDVPEDMEKAFLDAVRRADVVLVSGGLGPTEDDLTVDVLARLLGVAPVVDDNSQKRMMERYAAAKLPLTNNIIRQAEVPAGALVLGNPVGAAPGFEVTLSGVPVICMPGIPRELHAIIDSAGRDRLVTLREACGEHVERIARRIYRVFGTGESHVATLLEGILSGVDGASLHYQVQFPEVLVKIVVRDRDADAARRRLELADAEMRRRLGSRIYGIDDDSLPAAVGRALLARKATVATAESCTGGLIGALLTEVSGSSAYFMGGAITYSNAEKIRQLGVSEAVLVEHGAVSEACVRQMAAGARSRFGVDYAVAVSGIAGPSGGSADKPVGTVWLALAGPAGVAATHRLWPGDRDRIRQLAAYWALLMILQELTREDEHGE